MTLRYPATPRGSVVDDYHGTQVADPYRWLEDLSSPDTKAWIAAQNAVTLPLLEKLPQRAALLARLTQLWNYPRTSLPVEEAGQLFYRHNTGLQKQAPLYRRASPTAQPELLLDPNTLSADGSVSLADWRPSPDGRYLAYALSQGGADWAEVRIRNIATGSDLPDVVRWYRFSAISWTKDSNGFFYGRFPEPPEGQALQAELLDHQIHYHRVGTPQDTDRLVYWRRELPRYFVGASVTEDGRYLIVTLGNGTDPRNRLLYADLGDPLRPNLDAQSWRSSTRTWPNCRCSATKDRCFSCAPTSMRRTGRLSPSICVCASDRPSGSPSCPNAPSLSKARRWQEASCSATTWWMSEAACGFIRSPVLPRARSTCPASRALRA